MSAERGMAGLGAALASVGGPGSTAAERRAHKVALVALADLAEYHDIETSEHVLRVARMTHEIARTLRGFPHPPAGCNDAFVAHVGLASILHDVGKVAIPDAILLKPGPLTPSEWRVMKTHCQAGGAILRKAGRLLGGSLHFQLAQDVAHGHHEHWDGKGYPREIAGTDIPLAARIVTVADVYDALTSKRPYKEPWPEAEAAAYVRARAGSQFDPAVVDAFEAVRAMRARATRIEWNAGIEIGEPRIDHDHRILLALINQIAMEENREDPTAIEFILDELLSYAIYHFEREEGIMREVGFPGLAEHHRIHEQLIGEVWTYHRRFDEVGASGRLGEELRDFLLDWLIHHIMDEDRKVIPHLAGHAVPVGLAEAVGAGARED